MKSIAKPSRSLLALVVLACLGCGGSGSGGGSSSRQTNLVFTTTGAYNGADADLDGTTTAGINGAYRTFSLTQGNRTFSAAIPADLIQPGATLDVEEPYGTLFNNFFYRETATGPGRSWAATSGSVTITRISEAGVDVRVNDLRFEPLESEPDNEAQGTFTARGRITGIDIPLAQ